MSKKRTSAESSNSNGGEDSLILLILFLAPAQNSADYTKRARIVLLSDTTLEDLPMEVFERILIKVVTMEVYEMKLAKSVWKEKADVVLSRLGNVCPHWSNILTSDLFRNELHRVLESTGEKTIRLEIVQTHHVSVHATHIASLKDEIFITWSFAYLSSYDRMNLDTEKALITLKAGPADLAACNVSNCLYVLSFKGSSYIQIYRVTKIADLKYEVELFVKDTLILNCIPMLVVSANGCLIAQENKNGLPILWVFNPQGSNVQKVKLGFNVPRNARHFLIPKSNGNLALISVANSHKPTLAEVTLDGTILRQIDSRLTSLICCRTGDFGRLMLTDDLGHQELFDDELNSLPSAEPQNERNIIAPRLLHNDGERSESLSIAGNVLTICRFAEE